jgi:predicted TIM-barrel fold metal-dependent hydrolase
MLDARIWRLSPLTLGLVITCGAAVQACAGPAPAPRPAAVPCKPCPPRRAPGSQPAAVEARAAASQPAPAKPSIKDLRLGDWQPRSMLKVKQTRVDRPAFSVIDAHNHLGGAKDVAAVVKAMDQAGVKTVVNLDGYWGKYLRRAVARFDRAYPGRFLTFAQVDLRGIDDPDWTRRAVAQLERDFEAGAKGLKIHKSLGLYHRYKKTGKLVPIDDPKLDPIWALCGKYRRPVAIHSSDPAAFFTPLDRHNERWHELNAHPGWLFVGQDYPGRDELLEQRNRVIARHPRTTFVAAHFGNNPEDLETVGQWLDRYPNLFVDIDARISELGRQPYTARRFFIKYQDRILFGTDTFPSKEIYSIYYRFLETEDEYWDCARGHHRQGFWMIYGIHLPRRVLRKVYSQNARRLLRFKAGK